MLLMAWVGVRVVLRRRGLEKNQVKDIGVDDV
jgi:hypothetical protein